MGETQIVLSTKLQLATEVIQSSIKIIGNSLSIYSWEKFIVSRSRY